jgi:hypothetical protein
MSSDAFVATVLEQAPEALPIYEEHLADNDELLLHLFDARLRDLARGAFRSRDHGLAKRVLACIESGLTDGDEYVENAVAVSFVEDSQWWERSEAPYLATWPAALRDEVERQRTWRP